MTPAALSPSAVSWMEAIRLLRYCFWLVIASHLRQSSNGDRRFQLIFPIGQHGVGQFLESHQLIRANVLNSAFGKCMHKDRKLPDFE